jgi:hypothetical protein
LGDVAIHGRAQRFKEAMKIFAEAKISGYDAELWLMEEDSDGNRYAVISRVKRRGRNPKIKLLDRLDGETLDTLRLPKEFKIVGRWVECMALNDRKTLLVRGERLRLQPKARAAG